MKHTAKFEVFECRMVLNVSESKWELIGEWSELSTEQWVAFTLLLTLLGQLIEGSDKWIWSNEKKKRRGEAEKGRKSVGNCVMELVYTATQWLGMDVSCQSWNSLLFHSLLWILFRWNTIVCLVWRTARSLLSISEQLCNFLQAELHSVLVLITKELQMADLMLL